MEQHPIPQNISSYQFRLVGDMTLKQFFELAGGVLLGLIIYSLPLVGIIKWPFIILSIILGAALAFVPLEERPLESWIMSFFKAIYSPTVFNWKKTTQPVKYFQDESLADSTPSPTNQTQDAALKSYLESTRRTSDPLAKLEGAERGFLAALANLFAGMKAPTVSIPASTTPVATPPAQTVAPKKLEIPQSMPIKIVTQGMPHLVVEEKAKPISQDVQIKTQQVNPTMAGEEIVSTKEAIFSIDATPPNPPTSPNVVVGQVVDEARRIVEGAIIEFRDEYGRPIRALRSNKLGHFMAVTPLDNGKYSIICEKDGYQFVPVNFEARGEIIPPILVEGRRLVESGISNLANNPKPDVN
jgi:hypothetical protein